jgi:hypothetical protein
MRAFFGNYNEVSRIRRERCFLLFALLAFSAFTLSITVYAFTANGGALYTRMYHNRGFCSNVSVSLHIQTENYKPAFYVTTTVDYYTVYGPERTLFFAGHYTFDVRHKSLSACEAYLAHANAAIAASVDDFVPCYSKIDDGPGYLTYDHGIVIGTSDAVQMNGWGALIVAITIVICGISTLLAMFLVGFIIVDWHTDYTNTAASYGPVATTTTAAAKNSAPMIIATDATVAPGQTIE